MDIIPQHDPGDIDIFVELCEMCEDWWPAGCMEEVCKIGELCNSKICPDCMDDLRRKERKVIDRKKSQAKKPNRKK